MEKRRAVWIASLAMTLVTMSSSLAQAHDFHRLRFESPLLITMARAARQRSPTFRALVDLIEQSDLIVYLTCETFRSSTLAGQTVLAAAGPYARYLRVQILCRQSDRDLITIVAHELRHVVEVASNASVVDGRSFRLLFQKIGFATCPDSQSEQFETTAAYEIGRQVREEFIHDAKGALSASRLIAAGADALTERPSTINPANR